MFVVGRRAASGDASASKGRVCCICDDQRAHRASKGSADTNHQEIGATADHHSTQTSRAPNAAATRLQNDNGKEASAKANAESGEKDGGPQNAHVRAVDLSVWHNDRCAGQHTVHVFVSVQCGVSRADPRLLCRQAIAGAKLLPGWHISCGGPMNGPSYTYCSSRRIVMAPIQWASLAAMRVLVSHELWEMRQCG